MSRGIPGLRIWAGARSGMIWVPTFSCSVRRFVVVIRLVLWLNLETALSSASCYVYICIFTYGKGHCQACEGHCCNCMGRIRQSKQLDKKAEEQYTGGIKNLCSYKEHHQMRQATRTTKLLLDLGNLRQGGATTGKQTALPAPAW